MNTRVISGLVAQHVLKWGIVWQDGVPYMRDNRKVLPDIAIERRWVWNVIDHMCEYGYIWTIGSGEHFGAKAAAIFHKPDDPTWASTQRWSSAENEALAVSLAALKALGVEVPK